MSFDDVRWFEMGRGTKIRGTALRVAPREVALSQELADAMVGQAWKVGLRKQDGRLIVFAQPDVRGQKVSRYKSRRFLGVKGLALWLRAEGCDGEWHEAKVTRAGAEVSTVRVEYALVDPLAKGGDAR